MSTTTFHLRPFGAGVQIRRHVAFPDGSSCHGHVGEVLVADLPALFLALAPHVSPAVRLEAAGITEEARAKGAPNWERGDRVHGYWLDGTRVGYVGLTPRMACVTVYSWKLDVPPFVAGTCSTLGEAKRRVQTAWKRRHGTGQKPAPAGEE